MRAVGQVVVRRFPRPVRGVAASLAIAPGISLVPLTAPAVARLAPGAATVWRTTVTWLTAAAISRLTGGPTTSLG